MVTQWIRWFPGRRRSVVATCMMMLLTWMFASKFHMMATGPRSHTRELTLQEASTHTQVDWKRKLVLRSKKFGHFYPKAKHKLHKGALANPNISSNVLLPYTMIVGFQKCGSSSLFSAIMQHPHAVAPKLFESEPKFLYKELPLFNHHATWTVIPEMMLERFPQRKGSSDPRRSVLGSLDMSSPTPIYDVVRRIAYAYGPDKHKLRFLIIAGNPTLRAFSWFEFGHRIDDRCHESRERNSNSQCQYRFFTNETIAKSFYELVSASLQAAKTTLFCEELMHCHNTTFKTTTNRIQFHVDQLDPTKQLRMEMLTNGFYGPQLEMYLRFFTPDQFLVVDQREFQRNLFEETKRAWRFVGLNDLAVASRDMHAADVVSNVNPHNRDAGYSNVDAVPADRAAAFDLLDEFYKPFNTNFYNVIRNAQGGNSFVEFKAWRDDFHPLVSGSKSQLNRNALRTNIIK
eukprot:m.48759 g.48759  ORF g.48759 m.48759 type:complete len:458 (+) comp20845_c0_seq1:27-1400(+)